jgi:hypothetical protein
MSSAYQRFIEFFDLVGPQRLDGLDASYFDPMSAEERAQAYDYLLARVQTGGSEESINGLFLADERRALIDATDLLEAGRLRPKAEILAAWNIFRLTKDVAMMAYFAKALSNAKADVRGAAAYWAPASAPTHALIKGLQGMIQAETAELPMIHAVNKLLECHGVTKETVDSSEYKLYYRGLWSDDPTTKTATFSMLDTSRPVAFVDN